MSDDRPKRDSMSLEEATISNMWEIAAIVELLEQKGLCTKQAQYATSALAFGKEATVQTHGYDKYKRTLGDVFLPDGTNVNQELVK